MESEESIEAEKEPQCDDETNEESEELESKGAEQLNSSKSDTDTSNATKNQIIKPVADENENSTADINSENVSDSVDSTPEVKVPGKRGRKRKSRIYNEDDDPDTIKEKKKKRAVELKLKNLRCTFNETTEVSGKRQKKPPQRFELQPTEKRKSSFDYSKGQGEVFANIKWICHQLQAASLYTLRLLHRLIYRKQGMFAEKHIIKSVMQFSGYPFEESHPELQRRREQLEKLPLTALQQMSYVLGLRPGTHEEMIEKIIKFLLCPSQQAIENYIVEVMDAKLQQSKQICTKAFETSFHKQESSPYMIPNHFQKQEPSAFIQANHYQDEHHEQTSFSEYPASHSKVDLSAPWIKPVFFMEGSGVKLKYIRAVIANIEAASDAFVELMHRLLFLNIDDKHKMRRNILEFSGLKCEMGTPNYVYRVRILSVLPMEQLKLICRVFCLPTWHKSRQLLTDEIMDFLSVPRVSAMKKRVPPVFSEEISFSFDSAKANNVKLPELKSVETEEIEIIPDIHIPDETSAHLGNDFHMENEYLGVKLKNFSNIHYQVISTPAVKLSDVHMVLYLSTSAVSTKQNNIRRNILEFSGFPFDETSTEYQSRRALMDQMSIEDLKTVATVLCVSQYICDDSKKSLIEAILKFLLKPSALLSSSTIMPTISQAPVAKTKSSVVTKKATSTSVNTKPSMPVEVKPEIVISSVGSSGESKDSSVKAIIDAMSISSSGEAGTEKKIEIEKVKACLSNSSIEITPLPIPKVEKDLPKVETPSVVQSQKTVQPSIVVQKQVAKNESKEIHSPEVDEPLSNVKKEVAPRVQYFGSDDEDDQPLSKMIGHPNDDQLRALVSKIIKESKLEDITMKHVIRKVFETYPNYDLNYRREFIKSNVRLILSQMDDQSCSVSTTVITI